MLPPDPNTSSEGTAPEPSSAGWNSWVRFRLGLVFVTLVGYFAFIVFRLVQLQVLVNPELKALADKQFFKIGQTSPHRLAIYDRNREELAVSTPSSSIFAKPRQIHQRNKTARTLARILGGSTQHWLSRLKTGKSFVWIQRQVSEEVAKRMAEESLPGIYTEPENKRIYPNGPLAANVLGFTNVDGNGISGVELSLNEELLERGSRFAMNRDGKGNLSYLDRKELKQRSDDGKSGVYITIDRRIQQVLEEELEQAMTATSAKAVLAVVMDPNSGEIFAMGQRPTFDPNRAKDYSSVLFPDRVISSLYEPGSTMKVLMAAEAIEAGILTPKSLINCEHGKLSFGKWKIHDAEKEHAPGIIPLAQVIQVSSNVGAAKVAERLGVARVRSTLDDFGLTAKTGVSLPGEVASPPKPDRTWLPLFLATVGFGQGVSVTPLQMVTAFAPFANGGYRVRPRILLREGTQPDRLERHRVISAQTVAQMKEILMGVTEKGGTGFSARIPDIAVAGKTGTAQKYEPGVGYQSRKFLSSFIGFLPADEPQLLIGVFIDEPQGSHTGAQTAAPVFKRIAERSLQILDRAPKRLITSTSAPTPNAEESGEEVNSQEVAATPKPVIMQPSDEGWIIPDLKGISMRDALRLIGEHVENVKISGNGYLETQSPKAGTLIKPETGVALTFSPEG